MQSMMNAKVLRILSVNESIEDNAEILGHLENLNYPIESKEVTNIEDFKVNLFSYEWTVIFFISSTTTFSALEALNEIKSLNLDVPLVLISNGIGEEEVADMIKAGAEDVVLSNRWHRLRQVVKRIMRESEIKEKEVTASKIAHQAYAAREQMLAIASHDIKNPLSAIQLDVQMLLKVADKHGQTPLSENVKIQADRILKTIIRLKELIVDLLEKNKTENGLSSLNKTPCDLTKLFQDVYDANRPLIREKDLLIKTIFPDERILSIDKNKLFQVLNNLVSNAIKFTPSKGLVQFAIEESLSDFILSVADNGPGLELESMNKVFEKYWTGNITGCSGTGLGLFICKTIVEAHGGHIKVENLPYGGSKFSFTIPKICKIQNPNYWAKDTKRKIIIIDDDEDLREVISWALAREGYAVHSYADPREALESLKQGRHSPLLLVVDFHMDGMKGSEFLRNKQEINLIEVRNCPVFIITASPEEVIAESIQELYQQVLPKPIDLEALMANIKKLVV